MMQKPIELEIVTFYPLPGLPMEKQPESILGCMAVYGEGRGESANGQRAIAQVIANRYLAQKKYFGSTLREVILDRNSNGSYEFNCFNPTDVNYKKLLKPDMQCWYVVVRNCLQTFVRPFAETENPILYYHSIRIAVPDFFKRLKFVRQEGSHLFYTE